MKFASIARQHLAAIRALAVLTVITGLLYPVLVWGVAQLPGLRDNANGSVVRVDGKVVGSALIGQLYADADGNPLPQYFQGRPSAAGDGYDPMATSASNLGPEDIVDTADKPSLLTQVCTRSLEVAQANGVDGTRPFCTGDGVGAVLSVIGPRDGTGHVSAPTDVVSVNQPCGTAAPFLDSYAGVRVRCAEPGADYGVGQIVGVRGSAPDAPVVPVDAVTASASGLDPDISPAYADLQVNRVAAARGLDPQQVREVVRAHTSGRTLGFAGEPRVNVLLVNIALDELSMGG